jgi:hypothetical protein
MWKKALIFLILGVILSTAGCNDILPSQKVTVTTIPTPVPIAKYGIGDVVVKNSYDLIGEVVLNYNPDTQTYSTRTIIFGDFGNIYYNEGGGTSKIARADFEARYPYIRASIDNPHDLSTFDRKYDPKYKIGQVVTEENNPLEGIIILAYEYPRDVYTFAYTYQRGGKWIYDANITYEGARTDIERRFEDDD